ncbi:hypothetical protein [Myxococcus llanfairpwllgwyngyllgogerychwyrndrobwllllantysiliogogogochensis]|uniref:hypothetical protein n=1 Tax=Myxococcus llanfairpwllgwyngyllgogerychwyrndrobwllllantysiliogogogochensis TaxID=2590453 RepID=UPI0015EFF45D|nr:hypothetical protein [Myxococcus llanfairpwllgwyngyllgogerychwyrndrobwllllantysiliogogogochensis]
MDAPNNALDQSPLCLFLFLDSDLDDAVSPDVADFYELRLQSALSGESESPLIGVADL